MRSASANADAQSSLICWFTKRTCTSVVSLRAMRASAPRRWRSSFSPTDLVGFSICCATCDVSGVSVTSLCLICSSIVSSEKPAWPMSRLPILFGLSAAGWLVIASWYFLSSALSWASSTCAGAARRWEATRGGGWERLSLTRVTRAIHGAGPTRGLSLSRSHLERRFDVLVQEALLHVGELVDVDADPGHAALVARRAGRRRRDASVMRALVEDRVRVIEGVVPGGCGSGGDARARARAVRSALKIDSGAPTLERAKSARTHTGVAGRNSIAASCSNRSSESASLSSSCSSRKV